MDGKHVKWLAAGMAFADLVDCKLISIFLRAVIETAQMRALGVHVYDVKESLQNMGIEPNPQEPEGVSAVAVLSTSHCSLATWPHQGFFVFDLYSCSDFDEVKVETLLLETFKPGKIKLTDLSYSLSFGEDQLRAAARDALEDLERLAGPDRLTTKKLREAL